MVIKAVQGLLFLLIFIIPVAWWSRLNANYYSTKLTLFFLAGSLAWLAIPAKITLPKLPRAMLVSLVTIAVLQIAYHTHTFSLDDVLHIFKFLSFTALIFWLYSLSLNLEKIYSKTTYAVFSVTIFILAVSLYEFYKFRIANLSLELGLISTFGNINMFAEFLVLTVPFLFQWTRYKDKVPEWLKLLVFSLWFFFILYCRSRSAWIGLALWLVLQFRYKISRKELLYIGLSFILYFASIYAPTKNNINNINSGKESSFSERRALYQATFEMIKDHPWGIQVGSYTSEIIPYLMNTAVIPSEYSFYDQPHSEFLKWGAQFGWVFIATVAVFLLTVMVQLAKWFVNQKNSYLLESFMVLLPQMLFQFPFENPASLLYLSLVFALFFREFASEQVVSVHFSYRPVAFILFLAGAYSAAGFLNSVYQESTKPRNEKIVEACRYYPINIKACNAKLSYYIENKQFNNFLTEFKTDFVKMPFFVDYLRLLPTYYSVQQNNKKTCEALFLYATIFPEKKAFDNKYYENCKGFTNIFYFDDPQKFKARYLTWLNDLN